ncbi:glycosyltransferase family 31 [Trichoderma cornu-damae]|uniref:N-acetylgalactosaminide beta-1,3-galactosyltransferase n=1 Tax=Trichoderma cornu-damae TaxID=654480 RepID=A0A9P8QQH7_9HYPO|nr:glycosyltransferase family 31 [Trichoderma cornu-damae]
MEVLMDASPKTSAIKPFSRPKSTSEPDCAQFPDTSKILLVMKTGASEAFSKIPTQVLTSLKCLPEFLIFSDMEQEIAGYKIHDSLDRVLDSVKTNNRDFDIYFRQRQCAADQDHCNKHVNVAKEGWDLDKYKNVHIAEKTFEMRPDYSWYLFVDADTYVVWPTIVQWLDKLDHTERMYLGSAAFLRGFPFGHGGSGYVVSSAAMHDFFQGKNNVANRWDEATRSQCCGDFMFAKALKETTGVGVNNTWPTINGEKPFTIPYSKEEWCHPITTMHHVGSEELSDLYAFERERNFAFPMRIKDLYHKFVAPQLAPIRPDWDNLSDDVLYLNESSNMHDGNQLRKAKKQGLSPLEKMAHSSFDGCRQACEADKACLQYRFHRGICGFSWRIKHGHPRPKEGHTLDRWMSGWDVGKIQAWVREHDHCDEKINWPLVQKPRPWDEATPVQDP